MLAWLKALQSCRREWQVLLMSQQDVLRSCHTSMQPRVRTGRLQPGTQQTRHTMDKHTADGHEPRDRGTALLQDSSEARMGEAKDM